jgi:hypothetical protein
VFDCLETGKLTLGSIEVCADALVGNGAKLVLEELRGKSRAEAEMIAARYRPVEPSILRDRVQPIVVGSVTNPAQRELFANIPESADEDFRSEVGNCEPESKYRISFAASAQFMELLERAQQLLFRGDNEIDALLAQIPCHFAPPAAAVKPLSVKRKPIPLKLRDEILARDGYQCTYVAASGVRCECRFDLEIDHIIPMAHGGTNTADNIRVLCRAHNLVVEVEKFGGKFVESKIIGASQATGG